MFNTVKKGPRNINVYKYLVGGNKQDRLFSVMSSDQTQDSGHKQKAGNSLSARENAIEFKELINTHSFQSFYHSTWGSTQSFYKGLSKNGTCFPLRL